MENDFSKNLELNETTRIERRISRNEWLKRRSRLITLWSRRSIIGLSSISDRIKTLVKLSWLIRRFDSMIRFTINRWKNLRKRFRIWPSCRVLIQRVEIWGRRLSELRVEFMMCCIWIAFIRQKSMICWLRKLLKSSMNSSVLSNLYWLVNRLINRERSMIYSMQSNNMKKVWGNIER